VSERDVVALSVPGYVSTSRDDDLWGEAASGGGGEASAWSQLAGLGGFLGADAFGQQGLQLGAPYSLGDAYIQRPGT
jgi:hypothetical protein